jgi:hypothetical protein
MTSHLFYHHATIAGQTVTGLNTSNEDSRGSI